MDADTKKNIEKACTLQEEIQRLQAEQDDILKPIAIKAVASNNQDELKELVNLFPPGFYRMELRAFLIKEHNINPMTLKR